ncbi:DUF429 domain-containing protein [Humidisolicoccus flavus]|uniref:DUF429 domain-containing protein n=1 Tax=Humidisolicoccus flavus TaxID=3111414 RepID=UPI0032459D12
MLTVGVDLAAEPKGTAFAMINWGSAEARLERLELDVTDQTIVAASSAAEKIGIDCAFGWPDEFVKFLSTHANRSGDVDFEPVDGGMEWRRRLAYRETDRRVREATGRWPLSVATDRLGLTALRCAGLLDRLQRGGFAVDRAGSGAVVEVYPGATLRGWGIDTRGYKTEAAPRATLLRIVQESAPWLHLGVFERTMVHSADAFDAVISAIAARAAALGMYVHPEPELLDQAQREGWIALPNVPLHELDPSPPPTARTPNEEPS